MAITPEYGEEQVLGRDEAGVQPEPTPSLPGTGVLESEVHERELEARQRLHIDAESNELHVDGKVCERCGMAITVGQDARRLIDGNYVHEVCPPST
jgi:hypothetical protein